MRLLLRILVPLGVLGLSAAVVAWLMATRPQPELRQAPTALQAVDAIRLAPTNYQVRLPSQGTVRPRTQSTLKPQVSGRVLSVSPSFREGGFFEEGEVLLVIDPRDYETAVVVAEATLSLKESELELEKAQHEQAKENWALLGDGADPSPLTLREPQLAEALADVESARARLAQAQRDLARTQIRAPYAGRIQRKMVDVGQVVTPGNELASVFAIDFVEVRLPIRNDQLDFIQLPEEYRGEAETSTGQHPRVILEGTYGSSEVTWEGEVVRAEGAYDDRTRELFVVAQVDDPYARRGADTPPLKVGQFVSATVFGEVLSNVFVTPRSALRDDREVLIIDADNRIHRRQVDPIWRDETSVVIREGLQAGEVLCTTPLIFAADGAPVAPSIDGQAPVRKRPPGQPEGPGAIAGMPGPGPGPNRPPGATPERSP
jgi:RND family efflux transporter MFP subunit